MWVGVPTGMETSATITWLVPVFADFNLTVCMPAGWNLILKLAIEVGTMWAARKTLILSALLLGTANAYADKDGVIGTPLAPVQLPPTRTAPHIDYLGNHFFVVTEKAANLDPTFRNESAVNKNKVVPANEGAPAGLHWVPGNQHPAFEFRLSDQGAIRIHPSRHGGSVTAAWSF